MSKFHETLANVNRSIEALQMATTVSRENTSNIIQGLLEGEDKRTLANALTELAMTTQILFRETNDLFQNFTQLTNLIPVDKNGEPAKISKVPGVIKVFYSEEDLNETIRRYPDYKLEGYRQPKQEVIGNTDIKVTLPTKPKSKKKVNKSRRKPTKKLGAGFKLNSGV